MSEGRLSGCYGINVGGATTERLTLPVRRVAGMRRGGAPGGTRTHGLQVRNLTLYPLSYGRTMCGGEGGIRTLGAGYPTRRFSKPLH